MLRSGLLGWTLVLCGVWCASGRAAAGELTLQSPSAGVLEQRLRARAARIEDGLYRQAILELKEVDALRVEAYRAAVEEVKTRCFEEGNRAGVGTLLHSQVFKPGYFQDPKAGRRDALGALATQTDLLLELGQRCTPDDRTAVKALGDPSRFAVPAVAPAAALAVADASLPALSGVVGRVAQGLTDFILKRAREEVTAFVVDTLTSGLCAADRARDLFPTTCELLGAGQDARVNFVTGQFLRHALAADLRRLPASLAGLLRGRLAGCGQEGTDPAHDAQEALAACSLTFAQAVLDGLERRHTPFGLLADALDQVARDCACSVVWPWAGKPFDTELDSVVMAAELMALAAAQPEEGFSLVERAHKRLDRELSAHPLFARVGAVLDALAPLAERLEEAVAALRVGARSGTEERAALSRELVSATIDLLAGLIDQVFQAKLAAAPDDTARAAVQRDQRLFAALLGAGAHLVRAEFAQGAVELFVALRSLAKAEPLASLMRLGSLVVEIGQAETSDEVAAALEAAAAPAGSWRLRRQKTTFGLSAQLGAGPAYELLPGLAGNRHGVGVGLDAPVMVTFSTPIDDHRSAFGVGLQLVDLGTLARARLSGTGTTYDTSGTSTTEETVSEEPNLSIEQIFAPGVRLFFGILDTPFVFSFGAAYTIHSRKVTTEVTGEDPETEARNAVLLFASLGVDIPIFMW